MVKRLSLELLCAATLLGLLALPVLDERFGRVQLGLALAMAVSGLVARVRKPLAWWAGASVMTVSALLAMVAAVVWGVQFLVTVVCMIMCVRLTRASSYYAEIAPAPASGTREHTPFATLVAAQGATGAISLPGTGSVGGATTQAGPGPASPREMGRVPAMGSMPTPPSPFKEFYADRPVVGQPTA